MGEELESRKEECRHYFDAVDVDGNGLLTLDELQEASMLCGYNPTKHELKERYQDKMDTDGDRCISFDEFWDYTKHAPDPKETLRNAFETYDENKDGRIDLGELKAILMQDDQFDEQEVEETLQAFDVDGDNKLNYEEFVELMTQTFDFQQ